MNYCDNSGSLIGLGLAMLIWLVSLMFALILIGATWDWVAERAFGVQRPDEPEDPNL